MSDKLVDEYVEFLTNKNYPEWVKEQRRQSNFRRDCLRFTLLDGSLMRDNKRVLKTDEMLKKSRDIHVSSGHLNVDLLYKRMTLDYFWFGGHRALKRLVFPCDICSWHKRLSLSIKKRRPFATFLPLGGTEAEEICARLGLTRILPVISVENSRELARTIPGTTRNVVEDGNCFYRAISVFLTGTERQHAVIRRAVAEMAKKSRLLLQRFFGSYVNVYDYLRENDISCDKVPATEVEFMTAVLVLRRSVFIFDQKDERQQQSKCYWYQYQHDCLRCKNFQKSALHFQRSRNHVKLCLSVVRAEGITTSSAT